jgi:hypothetical protein
MSDQKLSDEHTHAAKLSAKRRGELAELAFMRKAANLGFAVAKPWGDSDRYDVVVRFENTFWRVQIKSVLGKASRRKHYRLCTRDWQKKSYSPKDIDFLVGYVFAEDLWYVFPADIVANQTVICLCPGSKKSRLEKYRGAWDLMRLAGANLPAPAIPPSPGEAPDGSTCQSLAPDFARYPAAQNRIWPRTR